MLVFQGIIVRPEVWKDAVVVSSEGVQQVLVPLESGSLLAFRHL